MINYIFKLLVILLLVVGASINIYSQPEKSLLSHAYPLSELQDILISPQQFHPFPTWEERDSWIALPEQVRTYMIKRGEQLLNYQWPALSATLFLDFVRTGNRRNFEKQQFARRHALANLVLAECVEGNGRFIDDIVNGIWAICEESFWGLPAHLSLQSSGYGLPDVSEPAVDIFAGETAGLLAWTGYLLAAPLTKISPLIMPRIQLELTKRILTPCLERDDFWWMGLRGSGTVNNHNPWTNSNWLTAMLLFEQDETKRIAAVKKIITSLEVFIDDYPPDGGCDEGPNYWNRAAGSLFDCLELLYLATDRKIDIYNESLIQEMGRYIYRAHIANRYFINFADTHPKVDIESELAYRYGARIQDRQLQSFAAFFGESQIKDGNFFKGSIGRQLNAIFNYSNLIEAPKTQPLLRDVWLEGIQVMAARSQQGSYDGLYVAAKGGHNGESHNHNDVGNFIIYKDGFPMIIDVGVETYTRKTFSAQRYDIWTMQSAYHNLPTINGIMQKNGRQFAASEVRYTFDNAFAQLRMNIADAYPPEAGVNQWIRTIRFNRDKDIVVTDAFDLNKEAQQIELSLMTDCDVRLAEPGHIILQRIENQSPVTLDVYFDPNKLIVDIEDIAIIDSGLKSVWGDRITRILLNTTTPMARNSWTIRFVP